MRRIKNNCNMYTGPVNYNIIYINTNLYSYGKEDRSEITPQKNQINHLSDINFKRRYQYVHVISKV